MKRILRSAVSLLLCAAVALGGTACGRSKLPTTITIWTYYNGDQLECFNQLVEQFNSTVGKEKNIRVESSSQGSVNDLETNVLAAAEGKVGAEKLPNIVSSYADTAFTLDQMGLAVDLSPYLTEKEKSAYIAGFLEEGDLMNNGELKVFPIAKSTELLYLNVTDFAPFAEATGVTYADLSTVEGLNEAAHKYYDWTDAQTATPNDGKALYGRDALTNYLLCGAQELGTTIFDAENGVMTLRFDKPTLRKLWDNYYVPYIKGWCSASGKFRSDDIKIGSLLAYVGSSSSASFFPTQVLTSDTESHGIEMAALPCPSFAGCEPVAVQQGAGMVVIPGTEDEISACVAFLKWFTQPENNLQFSVQSGYMPVTYAANSMSALENSGLTVSERIHKVLSLSIDAIDRSKLYTTHAFPDALRARNTLQYALEDRVTAGCAGGGVPAADLCRPRHPAWPPAEPERRGYPCHAGGQPQPVSSVHLPRCTGADQPFRYHQWPDPAAFGRGRDQPEHAGQQQRRGLSPAGSRRAGAHQHPAHQVGDRRVPYPEHP